MTSTTKTTAIAEYLERQSRDRPPDSNLPSSPKGDQPPASYIYKISALRKGSKIVTETIRASDKWQALRFFEDEHGPFSQYAIVCEDEPTPQATEVHAPP